MNPEEKNQRNPIPVPPPYYYPDDEITLKDLILKLREFRKEVIRNIWMVVLISLVGGGAFYAIATTKKDIYSSSISFLLVQSQNEQNRTFNLRQRGASTEDLKLIAISKSGLIINQVLLQKINIQGKNDFIGNHLIELYAMNERWLKQSKNPRFANSRLEDFSFTHDAIEAFSLKESRALYELQKLVLGINGKKGILNINYNDLSEIFEITVSTVNDELTDGFAITIFQILENFYNSEFENSKLELAKYLDIRADSLNKLLIANERSISALKDRTAGLIGSSQEVNISTLTREKNRNQTLYEETLKDLQRVKDEIKLGATEFKVLNRDFVPVLVANSKIKKLLIGLFLGGFLGSVYIIGRKIVRDAMAS